MKGRTVRIFLVDGIPSGILTAEIINWTGKAIVAPRSQLSDLARRPEVRRTGAYCIVGPDPNEPLRERMYVGEGDNVMTRLASHDSDESKDFWSRAVVFISKDDNITKSHGRYLESRIIALAKQAGRATIANGTAPDTTGLLPESDIADMEYFLEQAQMLLPILGMTFLQPQPTYDARAAVTGEQSPRFVMNEVGASAMGAEIEGEFVVFQGSTARKQGVESWTSYRGLRDRLVAEGKLINGTSPDYYVFAENVGFASPSAAAATVAARNTNGRYAWRVELTGQTYADWQESRLIAADGNSLSTNGN